MSASDAVDVILGELVPELWPAERTDVPTPVRFLHGLPALPGMFLLWFLPKTMGVRLAAAGWKSAVMAHVLGVTVGAGLIVWAEAMPYLNPAGAPPRSFLFVTTDSPTPRMPIHEYLVAPFAALSIGIHSASSARGWGIEHGIGAVAVFEAAMVVLALILMPYATAGERAGALFGRCLRLTWWSTTLFIPLGLGFMLDPILRRHLELPDQWVTFDYAMISLFAVFWVVIWLRSDFRYAGPPEGPGWRPRTPWCEACRYIIAGIPVTTKCPECGRLVRDSLPERRTLPAFHDCIIGGRRINAFLGTCVAILKDESFFDRLAIYKGFESARSFFFCVCGINAALVLITTAYQATISATSSGDSTDDWYSVLAACLVFLGQVAAGGLLALVGVIWGRNDFRPAASAAFWGMAALIPIFGAGFVSIVIIHLVGEIMRSGLSGWSLALVPLLLLSLAAVLGLLVAIVLRCVRAAISTMRHAQG